jgi:vancomycin resistance protein YoaR
MQNASIKFDGNQFKASDGKDGYVVDEQKFRKLLNEAYLGQNREVVVPMVKREMRVDLEAAEDLAIQINQAILEPITITYENASWQLNKAVLGSCIVTKVEQVDDGSWQMRPFVDSELLQAELPDVVGNINPGMPAENAQYQLVNGALQVMPSRSGSGISYKGLAEQLDRILFSPDGKNLPREAKMYVGTLEPEITTAMVKEFSFPQKIAEYTTEYLWASDNKITNIHLASDLINSSMIAPGATWSFNETAGDCTAERGFKEGKAVLDGELVNDIGGGICQVATTVFNAAYDAGYPISDRTNHSMYIASYPDGRDAAIAYPYFDLKFDNDTADWLLLVMSYTDESVTCSLWGVNPGYRVESVTSDWEPGEKYKTKEIKNPDLNKDVRMVKQVGEDGSTISVTRTVYDSNDKLLRQSTFWSVYDPIKEIIEIGTKE